MNAEPVRPQGSEAEQGGETPDFNPRRPRSARLHDFWLGGKDNFAADREAGTQALEAYPDIASSARATRGFLVRAVRFLAAQEGVRQFLDIGAGLPVAGRANTHEAARAVSPRSRVLYMDNDPAVGNHILARLVSDTEGCWYAQADLRRPEELLAAAAQKLDFDQPVAVMLIAVLHLISDADDPYGIVARLVGGLPAGSYLMLCHPAIDQHAGAAEAMARLNRAMEQQRTLRSYGDVERFFAGLDLIPPGLVRPSQWRPDSPEDAARPSAAWVGVARKPARARQAATASQVRAYPSQPGPASS